MNFHFNEFVIIQCAVEFCHHAITKAVPADGNHGVEFVSDCAKSFLLCFIYHGFIMGPEGRAILQENDFFGEYL